MKKTVVIGGMVAVTFAALAGGVMAQQANRPARAQAEMTQAAGRVAEALVRAGTPG